MTAREFAIDVVKRLQEAGFEALWAGGCVRDELLNLQPDDYDVATSARPEQVQKLFRRTIAIGAAFGVIEVIGPKIEDTFLNVQVATFRSDGVYLDGRRPDSVIFSSAAEDAQRRDFTINGLFFDPIANRLIDYVNGQADLQAKILRAIGDPVARFSEDKLRILRAVRMAMRFDLTIDPATLAAMTAMAGQIRVVSVERIAEEWRKMFAHPQRAIGIRMLGEAGLLKAIVPEFVHEISNDAIQRLTREASFELTMATLFLSSGHAAMEKLCHQLKLSNDETRRIVWLVKHAFVLKNAAQMKASQLYPVLAHPHAQELIELHHAYGHDDDAAYGREVMKRTPRDRLDPPYLINGDDLKTAGFLPSPKFKLALDAIRAMQLDGEVMKQEEALRKASMILSSPLPL